MLRHGIKGIIGGGSALMLNKSIHAFQAAHERAGMASELGTNLALGISFHLAPTHEQAVREATPYYEEHVKMFAPLGFLGRLDKEQHLALMERGGVTKSGVPTLEDNCQAGSWYCGPPDGFVAFLQKVAERYPGLEDINVQSSLGTPQSVMVEQLQQFAEEVMPKVLTA